MYDQAVEGNLEALRKYHILQQAQEDALADIVESKEFRDIVDQIAVLATELHDRYDNSSEWDFTDEVDQEIKDVLREYTTSTVKSVAMILPPLAKCPNIAHTVDQLLGLVSTT